MVSSRSLGDARPAPPPIRGTLAHFQTYSSTKLSSSGLNTYNVSRLKQLKVCELHADGSSTHSSMNLRTLYNHVVKSMTEDIKAAGMKESKGAASVSGGVDSQVGEMDSIQEEEEESEEEANSRKVQTTSPRLTGASQRERLGGYLHPRDMRRLVTPFSPSNEPQLMVRRHVMLFNFDPLRAVVLRDRLLVLLPDGAKDDSMLHELEKKLRGGVAEMENDVFGSVSSSDEPPRQSREDFAKLMTKQTKIGKEEWEDLQNMDWKKMAFEFQSVDAVLKTVVALLVDDARDICDRSSVVMKDLLGDGLDEHAQNMLRLHKDEVDLMEGRVDGFTRGMNEVLDDNKQMALMNLSRLIKYPEKFVQPVSDAMLQAESDEPELILESFIQDALSIVNELDLIKKQIGTTEEQISMQMNAIRNRLLYINTLLSVASLVVGVGSFVGSLFGMNFINGFENNDTNTAFVQTCTGTIIGMFLMWIILSRTFYRAANNIHSGLGRKFGLPG